jgi:ubiquinone/menaquinone biosynthesis C-methylase UbiE
MCKSRAEISRVTRSKKEARASYDRMSRWYDTVAGHFESMYRDIGLAQMNTQEGELILEIGCGTGHSLLALAQSVGCSGKVYGIDISEGMLDISRARVRRAGLSDRITLTCGDATDLPFRPHSFDAILVIFTLELFDTPEIPIVLCQCRKVLRDTGRICLVAMSKKGKAGLVTRLYEWAHRKFPRYIDCRPIPVWKALKDAGLHIVDASEVSRWTLLVEVVVAKKGYHPLEKPACDRATEKRRRSPPQSLARVREDAPKRPG